ncbi:unnamed protein product [Protopolystoma xenopodis]|uniref:Cytochrome c oxidase subunit 5A, mitochondrial n=1 Tax=Protopolystoma xenopodis TaxID=117903 RepID=A0A448X7G9_9PLAT|nr:unnamed protein product [Protopolystoma xenopodis]
MIHITKRSPLQERYSAYVQFFKRPDLDHWYLRQGLGELILEDAIPNSEIITSALEGCRKHKTNAMGADVWPWLLSQIQPVLDKHGIPTPEQLGYDKPELAAPEDGYY